MKIELLKETSSTIIFLVSVNSDDDSKNFNDILIYQNLLSSSKGILFKEETPINPYLIMAIVKKTIANYVGVYYPKKNKYIIISSHSKEIKMGDLIDQ